MQEEDQRKRRRLKNMLHENTVRRHNRKSLEKVGYA